MRSYQKSFNRDFMPKIFITFFILSFISIMKVTYAVSENNKLAMGRPIKVLLLSGSNNHDWKKTTPLLSDILNRNPEITAIVCNEIDTLDIRDFNMYDVVVSNWNDFPERNCPLGEKIKDGLVQFVSEGGGIVYIHAASAACTNWEGYQHMAGASWGTKTRHGKIDSMQVNIDDKNHPITKGIEEFWIVDELWVEIEKKAAFKVLAKAYSKQENNGRNQMEPVLIYQHYGKGKSVYNILGHDVRAMKNTSWQELFLRSVKWVSGNL